VSSNIRILIFLVGLFIFLLILNLVRKKKFREELSVIWLVVGVCLILSSGADLILDPLATKLGIHYPPALILPIISILFVLVVLYFSIVVSDLKTKGKELAQKIALMEYELNKIKKLQVED
jgi:hypothetical protein